MRWVLRLIATGDTIRSESADLIEINLAAGVGAIADYRAEQRTNKRSIVDGTSHLHQQVCTSP